MREDCAYQFTGGLIGRIVPNLEVWVVQRLSAADTLSRVEAKQLREQIDGEGVSLREDAREWDTGFDGEGTDIFLGLEES